MQILWKYYTWRYNKIKATHCTYLQTMEGCLSVPEEVTPNIKLYMPNALNEKRKKKERFISSLNEDNFYEIDEADSDEIEEVGMTDFERRQMKHAMRESRCFF